MAMTCENCGLKTNEVKSGGAIKDHGCRLSLTIKEVGPGALCSRFTTVEGLLTATREQLSSQSSFFMGDSASSGERSQIEQFLDQFDDILSLKKGITVVLDDPAGNSYIQSLTAPMEDPRLHKEFYQRTFEQNDELGLNDMKVVF
ncbi:ZPR1 zinc-finger domain protein [Cooperia oncophora]